MTRREMTLTNRLVRLLFVCLAASVSWFCPSIEAQENNRDSNNDLHPATVAREAFPTLSLDDWNEIADSGNIGQIKPQLFRIASRLRNVSPLNHNRYIDSTQTLTLNEAQQEPRKFAGSMFHVTGTTKSIQRISIPEDSAWRNEFNALYVLQCLTKKNERVSIVATDIPSAWRSKPDQQFDFETTGCFVTVNSDDQPVLIANRMAWSPNAASPAAGISQGKLLLAKSGLDLGLFDDVVNGSRRAFVESEFELFHGLTTTVAKVERQNQATPLAELKSLPEFPLVPILRKPGLHTGDLYQINGVIERISEVQTDAKNSGTNDTQASYFHIDLFVSTGNQAIRLIDKQGEYTVSGKFGITLILLELPPELVIQKKTLAADETYLLGKGIQLSIPGWFIKNWRHRTTATQEVSTELRRPNPIVFGIASACQVMESKKGQGPRVGNLISWFWLGLIAMLVSLGVWQWLLNRRLGHRRRGNARSAGSKQLDFSNTDLSDQ